MTNSDEIPCERKIMVTKDGPYLVLGNVPLVAMTQIVSEFGEPLAWRKDRAIDTGSHELCGTYSLCRCGRSSDKPFCDCTHQEIAFDGTETADLRATVERQAVYPGVGLLIVRHDDTLCAGSGFCGNRNAHLRDLVKAAAKAGVPLQIIAMIEHCPSGSLTYAPKAGEPVIEPDLPQQIALTTEITSEGPISGPLWATGYLPLERSDGQPFETRNRVTLCCCGRSKNKPLCDGTHREA
jgi:CDGSH-type Zn-finger protein